jgi:type IV secretory pathway TrbF-like protein
MAWYARGHSEMGSETALVWSMLFGAVGVGYFIYGRRQGRIVPFVSGVGLMVVPYFIDGTGALVAACIALMALPYFVRR